MNRLEFHVRSQSYGRCLILNCKNDMPSYDEHESIKDYVLLDDGVLGVV